MSASVRIVLSPRRSAVLTTLILTVLAVSAGKSFSSGAGLPDLSAVANAPLYFEANHGQADDTVRFIARGYQCDVLLAPTEATLVLSRRETRTTDPRWERTTSATGITRTRTIRLILEGANPDAKISGQRTMPGKVNYLLGDPAEWHTGVPLFAGVRVDGVYPGVDVVYYADQSARLEYDFVLQPSASADRISFRVEGADHVSVNAAGELVLKIGRDEVIQRPPVLYQEFAGGRKPVAGGYRMTGKNTVSFRVGDYDHSRPLVIDPVILSLSTYFGGSKDENGWGIAVDPTGIYIAGETLSKDLHTTPGAFTNKYGGGMGSFGDAFVAKYDPEGTNLIYLTYLGGKTDDAALAIAVTNGVAYLTGFTDSRNFPITPTNNPANTPLSGRNNNAFRLFPVNAFVAALDSTGSSLVFSLLLGGNKRDAGEGIAVDQTGVYITGMTESTNFPVFPAAAMQTNFAGNSDGFVAKLDPTGTSLVYATYLGGNSQDFAESIAVDNNQNAWVTGFTSSRDFPTTNAIVLNGITYTNLNTRTNSSTSNDAFVSKISSDGLTLLFSSYLGGSNTEAGIHITVDATNGVYVTGHTSSRNFPTNTIPQPQSTGTNFTTHAFLTKLNPDGTVAYSAQFGGSKSDEGRAVAVDGEGKAYVAGVTVSTNFFARLLVDVITTNCTAVTNCVVTTNKVPTNFTEFRGPLIDSNGKKFKVTSQNTVFVAILTPDGSAFTTNGMLIGGAGGEEAHGIVVDPAGSTVYLVGRTTSPNFPVTTNAPQRKLGNAKNNKASDAFVQKILIQP